MCVVVGERDDDRDGGRVVHAVAEAGQELGGDNGRVGVGWGVADIGAGEDELGKQFGGAGLWR